MNELAGKDTDTKEDEAVSLKEEIVLLKAALETLTHKLDTSRNEIDTLKLIIESLTSGSGSKTQKTDIPRIDTDTPPINTDTFEAGIDTPSIITDTPAINTDTPAVDTDTPAIGTDTPEINIDTPEINIDTPAINIDTSVVNTDTPAIKISKILFDDPIARKKSQPYKSKRATIRKYIKNLKGDVSAILMKNSEDISCSEITRLLEYWKKRPLRAFDYKIKIDKSLDTINSFLSNKQKSISSELKKEIEWEKVVLSIKKEILTRLKKKDMVRFRTIRLIKALFYLKEKSSVDMKTLIADLNIPRITVCRELQIFRNFGWAKTTGRGPTARYSLTDEGRNFIKLITDQSAAGR